MKKAFTNKQIRTMVHQLKKVVCKKYLKVPNSLEEMKEIWMNSLEIEVENRQFWITGDGYKSFWEIVDLLLEDGFISNNISAHTLSSYVKDCVIKYFRNDEKPEVLIQQLIERATGLNEEREFWFIIDGISFKDINALEIGKVTFIKAGEAEAATFYEDLPPLVGWKIMTPTPSKYEKMKENINEKRKKLIGNIIAKCVATGDFDKGKEKAFNLVQEALNVIRLYIVVFSPDSIMSRYFQINIQGYTHGGIENVVASNINTKDRSRFWGSGISKKQDLEISKEAIEALKEYGLEEFTRLLKKENELEFDQMLKRALYWAGEGIDDPNIHSSYVKFVTALEVLFGPRKKEWITCPDCGTRVYEGLFITNKVSKGVAVTVGEGIQDIKELCKKAKKYYDHRSNILHKGVKEDLPLKEVAEITCWSILKLLPLHNSYKERTQVLSNIERLSNIAKL